jgi:hypothetical protein
MWKDLGDPLTGYLCYNYFDGITAGLPRCVVSVEKSGTRRGPGLGPPPRQSGLDI